MARASLMWLVVTLVAATAPAGAQTAPPTAATGPEPKLVSMFSSANDVFHAIDVIMSLTGSTDQKQTKVLKNYLDVFLIGVDRAKPVRMDWLIDEKQYRYLPAIPVPPDQMRKFTQDNLAPLGIQNRRTSLTLYRLTGKVFNGWMRYDDNYAWFGEEQDDLGQRPAYLPPPAIALETLLGKNYLIGGEMVNTPKGVEQRHAMFNHPKGVRDQSMSQLKPAKNESASDFEFRKLGTEHSLDVIEQYIAEGRHGEIGLTLDSDKKEMRADFALTAIADTPLGEAVRKIGEQPSRFAAIPRHEQPVLSGRFTMPLDALRRENLLETLQMMRKRRADAIDARTTPKQTAAQKAKNKEAVDLAIDMAEATVRAGLSDMFGEIWSNGKTHTAVAGVHTPEGMRAVDVLKLMPESLSDQELKLEVDSVGDVTIHALTLSKEMYPTVGDFFGTYQAYVGTSKESVWFAIGENALPELKTAIGQTAAAKDEKKAGEEGAPTPFALLNAQPGPLMDLLQPPDMADMPDNMLSKYRDIARRAFEPGDDRLIVEVLRLGDDVRGYAHASPGILRFLGMSAAEFSRENLDEEGRRRPKQQAASR